MKSTELEKTEKTIDEQIFYMISWEDKFSLTFNGMGCFCMWFLSNVVGCLNTSSRKLSWLQAAIKPTKDETVKFFRWKSLPKNNTLTQKIYHRLSFTQWRRWWWSYSEILKSWVKTHFHHHQRRLILERKFSRLSKNIFFRFVFAVEHRISSTS